MVTDESWINESRDETPWISRDSQSISDALNWTNLVPGRSFDSYSRHSPPPTFPAAKISSTTPDSMQIQNPISPGFRPNRKLLELLQPSRELNSLSHALILEQKTLKVEIVKIITFEHKLN